MLHLRGFESFLLRLGQTSINYISAKGLRGRVDNLIYALPRESAGCRWGGCVQLMRGEKLYLQWKCSYQCRDLWIKLLRNCWFSFQGINHEYILNCNRGNVSYLEITAATLFKKKKKSWQKPKKGDSLQKRDLKMLTQSFQLLIMHMQGFSWVHCFSAPQRENLSWLVVFLQR